MGKIIVEASEDLLLVRTSDFNNESEPLHYRYTHGLLSIVL